MANKIQLRRDTAANWTAANPVLAQGEPGIELDTGKAKYGDGLKAWKDLLYSAGDSFLQAGANAKPRTSEAKLRDIISVRDFGAVGDGVADDTAALQAAINAALTNGKLLLIDGPGPYKITSTLTAKITRDAAPSSTSPASNVHFSDLTPLTLLGCGMPTIKAGAAMPAMIELIFDTSDSDLGPFYSKIEGIGLDGGGVATTGIKLNYSMHVTIERNRIWNIVRGIEITGYGVATITQNVIRADTAIRSEGGGGDSSIYGNDFYSSKGSTACIALRYFGGNTKIFSNTFTNENWPNCYAIQLLGSTAPASEEIRDIDIRFNEFCGFATGVRMDGKSAANKNVYKVEIIGNHAIHYGATGTGTLVEAVDCKSLNISSNFCNSQLASAATGKAMELVRCDLVAVSGNFFTNYNQAAISLSDCTEVEVQGCLFEDCGKAGASYVVVVIEGAGSKGNRVARNTFKQSATTYANYAINETGGANYTYASDNIIDGFKRPYTKVGANSVMRRAEFLSAVPATGTFNVGDIIWNSAPTAGGVPGWICITGGVDTYVFKAMQNLAA